ncbi:hypothetical protein [Salegentibacter salegens]|uniref:Lipoprotein n=1 Tax=Salegentibacter salegens TaxID=143223 RepID=A0A1M7KSH3_9FLAO|nr:hypothetical protein [Salegentibacter salegens]PRX48822.1 hypothetical protein LY58_01113 [Salegentibacter salegens]SHM68393.1 hypothetical protein SAMN05878281_1580 [Salegentibacter salegens]
MKKFFIFISVLTLLYSCDEEFKPLKFEKQVAYKIFPQLIDSLHRDVRVPIPPPPFIRDNNADILALDTIESKKKWEEYELLKKKYYKDSVKLVIAISDSTYLLSKNDKKAFLKFYKKENIELDSTKVDSRYKIILDSLNADKKLKLKYLSEFPEGSEIWSQKNEYDFFLNGATGFSRIKFDKTYSFGVLTSNYSMGRLNGFGVRIFIKKVNGLWIIDKIETTTIS